MENELNLKSKIEALLFFKGEPLTLKKISEILEQSTEEIDIALNELINDKKNTGLQIVKNGEEIMLGTSSLASNFIETLRKEELNKELSKASIETLSIILYKNKDGITRNEIDYIRGVNSSFILRNLLIRGLIQKSTDEKDNRRLCYKPTLEALQFLGVDNIESLPRYTEVVTELNKALIGESELNNPNTNE